MNKAQYQVVKFMTGFPKIDLLQFAKLISLEFSEVLRVQATNNFEQYQTNDTPAEDLMSFFGGAFRGKK